MLDFTWLFEHRASKNLRQGIFFQQDKAVLFLPSLPALGLLGKAEVISHADSLYSIDQAVFGEKTIGYIITALCPTLTVYSNLLILHTRKTIDVSVQRKVYVQNSLPHFDIVNDVTNTTSMFCRNMTTTPKT